MNVEDMFGDGDAVEESAVQMFVGYRTLVDRITKTMQAAGFTEEDVTEVRHMALMELCTTMFRSSR